MKNLPAKAGGIRDAGLTPGTGRSPGEGNDTHSSTLIWRIPEGSGAWLQSVGPQRVGFDFVP